MALIFPGRSRCSICGEVIGQSDDIVATTHFIADRADPLWRFSDSAMHRACYDAWPHRHAFAAQYVAAMVQPLVQPLGQPLVRPWDGGEAKRLCSAPEDGP